MKMMYSRCLLLTAILLPVACHESNLPTAPIEQTRPPGAEIQIADLIPGSIHWPLDATGSTPTGPYNSSFPITSIFDHWNAKLRQEPCAAKLPGKYPKYSTGPDSHLSGCEQVYSIGKIVAPTFESGQFGPCGYATGGNVRSRLAAVGINYTATAPCFGTPKGDLSYDNHPGVDIGVSFGTQVFAPADGWVSYEAKGPDGYSADILHSVAICLTKVLPNGECDGWKVRVLHLSSYFDGKKYVRATNTDGTGVIDCNTPTAQLCAANRKPIKRGDPLGYSGNYQRTKQAPSGWKGVAEHLHLEVVDGQNIPHDPYGWQDATLSDPMGAFSNGSLWEVPPPAQIVLSTSGLSFTIPDGELNPPSRTVDVTSYGVISLPGLSATVTYPAGSAAGWLTASLNSTTTPATLTVSAVRGPLAPGAYLAGITVRSSTPGVTNAPKIAVSFLVTEPPGSTELVGGFSMGAVICISEAALAAHFPAQAGTWSYFLSRSALWPNGSLSLSGVAGTAETVVGFSCEDGMLIDLTAVGLNIQSGDDVYLKIVAPSGDAVFAAWHWDGEIATPLALPNKTIISQQVIDDTWSSNQAGNMSYYKINSSLSGTLGSIRAHVKWKGTQNLEASFLCYVQPDAAGAQCPEIPAPVVRPVTGESAGEYIDFDFSSQNFAFDPTKYYILLIHNQGNCSVVDPYGECNSPEMYLKGTTQDVSPNTMWRGHGLTAPFYQMIGK
jgi:murein DD-endopeptidase MepM/ murein hydrolase activator NlpD